MASRYFSDPRVEQQNIFRAQAAENTARQFASQDGAALAARLDSIGRAAPWVKTDAALSLAQSGVDADHPDFEKLAKAAGKAKTKRGFGWHSIGDVVTAPFRKTSQLASSAGTYAGRNVPGAGALGAAATGLGRGIGYAGNAVKPVSRAADLAFSAPIQEMQGQFRNLTSKNWSEVAKVGALPVTAPFTVGQRGYEAVTGEQVDNFAGNLVRDITPNFQSTLAVAADQRAEGRDVDLGEGYFAGGKTKTEQTQRARDAGSIDGHAVTPGRWLANQTRVIEPGTFSYNLLSGLIDGAIGFADPGAKIGTNIGQTRKIAKTSFVGRKDPVLEYKEGVGLVDGNRKDLITDRVNNYLNSEDGAKLGEYIKDSDFATLYKRFGDKVDSSVLVHLADITDPRKALEDLKPLLGLNNQRLSAPGLRDQLRNAAGRTVFRKDANNVRLLQAMPDARGIDPNDVTQATKQIDLHAKNALLPEAKRNEWIEKMARTQSPIERFNVSESFLENVTEHLGSKYGLGEEGAKKLTRMYGEYNKAERSYWIDAVSGQKKAVPGIDEDQASIFGPHLYNEYINHHIPMPNASDIRGATKVYGRLLNDKVKIPVKWNGEAKEVDLHIKESNELAKYLTVGLWKAATLLRPAYTVRVEGESQLRMAGAGFSSLINHPIDYFNIMSHRKAQYGATGAHFKDASDMVNGVDEYAAALTRRNDYRKGGQVAGFKDALFDRTDISRRDEFIDAWADDIIQHHFDDISKKLTGDWADDFPDGVDPGDFKTATWQWGWDGAGKAIREDMAKGKGRQQFAYQGPWSEYVDSVASRIDDTVAGDPKLIEAISKGTFNGKPITMDFKVNQDLKNHLRQLADSETGPRYVAGQRQIKGGINHPMAALDGGISRVFAVFAGMPANKFSRSPVFRQTYWQRMEELLPFMDGNAQATALKNAGNAKIDTNKLQKIVNGGNGDLSLNEADQLAKLAGLKKTQDLLYDLSRRSQFFDAYEVAFPFGDAWLEVMNTWRKLAVENPGTIRRAQQTIQGGRAADPDNDGQGFIYKDPTTGQDMFTIPFSKHINEALLDVPIPFSSPVKGLNIFGSILPGIGPVMQIPAGALIPDIPETEAIRQMIFPMGEVDRDAGGFVESFYPAWMKKILNGASEGAIDERQYNNSVSAIFSQLMDQGKYDPTNKDDVTEAWDEARSKAKWLFVLQGAAQSTAPSPPTQDFLVHNQDGRLVLMDYLKNDLTKMYEEDRANGTNTALQRFLDKYGNDAIYAVQPRSEQVSGFVPRTEAASDWAKSNGELREKYPKVYGLFAPAGEGFDIAEFSRQIKSGETRGLKPEEVAQNAQAALGNLMYRRAQEKVKGRNDKAATEYLSNIREQIINEYPGWGEQKFSTNQTKVTVNEIDNAMKDPRVSATDAGKGYALYAKARQKALAEAKAKGRSSFESSKDTQYLRDWLNNIAEKISVEHPDFANMHRQVLARETSKKVEQ